MSHDFDSFMKVIKGIRSSPDSAMMEKSQRAIYFADQPIRGVFFSHRSFQEFSAFGKSVLQDKLVELAVKYCSFVVAKTSPGEFSKPVKSVSFLTISDWFQRNGIPVGRYFIVDFMNTRPGMPAIEKDKERFRNELMATCCNDVFIDGFMLECFTASSLLPVVAFLNYVDYLDPSQTSSDKLLAVWIKNSAFERTVHYREHDWLETIVILFDERTGFFESVKTDALQACRKPTKHKGSYVAGSWNPSTSYGDELKSWLKSQNGPQKYGLR